MMKNDLTSSSKDNKLIKKQLIKLATAKKIDIDKNATNKELIDTILNKWDLENLDKAEVDKVIKIPKGRYGIIKNGKLMFTFAFTETPITLTSVMDMLKPYIAFMRENKGTLLEIQFSNGLRYRVTRIKRDFTQGFRAQIAREYSTFADINFDYALKIAMLMGNNCELNLQNKIKKEIDQICYNIKALNSKKLKTYIELFRDLDFEPADITKKRFLDKIGGIDELSIVNQKQEIVMIKIKSNKGTITVPLL